MRVKYYADMYSATFFCLSNQYKWKYKFTDDDISHLLFECYCMMLIQFSLAYMIVVYGFDIRQQEFSIWSFIAGINKET